MLLLLRQQHRRPLLLLMMMVMLLVLLLLVMVVLLVLLVILVLIQHLLQLPAQIEPPSSSALSPHGGNTGGPGRLGETASDSRLSRQPA